MHKTRKIDSELTRLLNLAIFSYREDPELSQNALDVCWNLCVHTNSRVPKFLRLLRCKNCGCIELPGETAQVRLIDGYIVWRCLKCSVKKRIKYKC